MTVAVIPTLAILLYLGTWQLMRLQWKGALIDEFTSRATAEAVIPPAENRAAQMRFQRLRVSGVWMHDAEVQLTGRLFEGTPGYHVITPMRLDDGRILILNRGWVSQDYRRAEARPLSLDDGRVKVEAILRLPFRKGYFVPENDPDRDDWFTLKIDDIATHHDLGGRIITTYSADVLRPDGPYTLPIGAAVEIDIPNDHWNYALTWFGIALGLIGVYLAWHVQAGRLRFSRGDAASS
jgi:surfeit locus 1 family protein